VVNLELLSDNLTIIIDELIGIQNIAKYLAYDLKNPLGQPLVKIPAKSLVLDKIYPYPFDPVVTVEDCSQLRVYYPKSDFKSDAVIGNIEVNFDIVVAKSLWLINDGLSKSSIRPFMIMKEIVEHFNRNSIKTLGQLDFEGFIHLNVNEKFGAIRLVSTMTLVG
jgi:hypothetical protein